MRKKASKAIAPLLAAALVITGITVPGKEGAAASKVKISKTAKTLYVGGTAKQKKVSLTVKKGKTNLTKKAVWKSSKTSVAKVGKETGKVTAVKAGTAKITATYKKKKYTCTVTVKDYYVTKIAVSPAKVSLAEGGKQTLTVKYNGVAAKYVRKTGVTFKSSDTSVAKVSSKGVITGVKAGTAKVTVTAKSATVKPGKTVAKSVTVTVTGASATASPAASAEPGTSADPDATAGPNASADPDASASPAASADPDASASPNASTEPSKEPSVVTEIKILNDVALTNPDTNPDDGKDDEGQYAYVYYDVLDQYGESMRSSVDIQWTTTPAGGVADKTLGRITIPKNSSTASGAALQKFSYGEKIFVNAVYAKTGLVKQAEVTIGMTQAVDTVKFAGFVDSKDTSDKMDNLPKNFAKNRYYMLFKTFDQNGNALDVTLPAFAGANVMFVGDNPTLLTFDDPDANTYFSVKGEEYAAVPVQPGMYVDKGGEVNVTAISRKTGGKTPINIVVGANPQLQSLKLSAPSDTVADGDTDVEIPFVAKDTAGNTITNYETIVRSANTLSLNTSVGTLVLKEKDDGTAGLYWSDDMTDYNPKAAATYNTKNADITNGVERIVSLMSIVMGGESDNIMMNVSDMRIPTTISSVDLPGYIAVGGEARINFDNGIDGGGYGDRKITFKDQYGKDLDLTKAKAFFQNAASNKYGQSSEAGYYGILVEAKSNHLGVSVKDDNILMYNKGNITFTGTFNAIELQDKAKTKKDSVKFYIVKNSAAGTAGEAFSAAVTNWNTVSRAVTKEVNVLALSELGTPTINGLGDTVELSGLTSAPASGSATVVESVTLADPGKDYLKFTVEGDYNGNKVVIPMSAVSVTSGSKFNAVYNEGAATAGAGEYLMKSYVTSFNASTIKYNQFFDYTKYNEPAKIAYASLDLTVDNGIASGAAISKDVAVCVAEKEVTSLKFSADEKTLHPRDTKIVIQSDDAFTNEHNYKTSSDNYEQWWEFAFNNGNKALTVYEYSQYGRTMSGADVLYTISDYVENDGEFAHVKGNHKIAGNGTSAVTIEGAELGDTFTITAKVKGTTLTATCKIKVGADRLAYIASKDVAYWIDSIDTSSVDADSDKAFREGKLDYSSSN